MTEKHKQEHEKPREAADVLDDWPVREDEQNKAEADVKIEATKLSQPGEESPTPAKGQDRS